MSKVAEIFQGPDESLGNFMEQLKEAFRQYSTIDPEDLANRQIVNTAFVQQCAKDIRRKIQKLDGFLEMEPSQMMEVARKMYANRDTEEEKAPKEALVVAVAIRGEYEGNRGCGRGRGRGCGRGGGWGGKEGGQGWTPLGYDQCAIFQQLDIGNMSAPSGQRKRYG